MTEEDEADLRVLHETPAYQESLAELSGMAVGTTPTSEAAMLHAIFEAGLSAVRSAAEERGYAEVASRQVEQAQHRTEARRRRPSWADDA